MSVDGLDHVSHVDDLDLVNDAALTDALQTANADKRSRNSPARHHL